MSHVDTNSAAQHAALAAALRATNPKTRRPQPIVLSGLAALARFEASAASTDAEASAKAA